MIKATPELDRYMSRAFSLHFFKNSHDYSQLLVILLIGGTCSHPFEFCQSLHRLSICPIKDNEVGLTADVSSLTLHQLSINLALW